MGKSRVIKHKSIKLESGFYAIRYASDADPAPIALLKSLPVGGQAASHALGTKRDGTIMLSPDSPMALFHIQGSEASIIISLLLPDGAKTAGVTFDVERLPERLPKKTASSSSLVYLSGHVEWKGDIKAAPGTYLGAEKGTARIEGFTINWLKLFENIDIKYGCTFGEQEETSTALGGGFVGSRGLAAPITSVWMELEGTAADQFNLQFTAVFSKSGPIKGRQAKVVSGIQENDHLVGLWVSIDDAGEHRSIAPSRTGRKIKELKTFRA